jgi:Icc protein
MANTKSITDKEERKKVKRAARKKAAPAKGPRAPALAARTSRRSRRLHAVRASGNNHDCFGVYPASGVLPTDPLYGKKYFEDHFGKLYYSFDHKGVHFIVLDSIGITADRAYEGRVDAAQLAWLAADLKALPAVTPIVVSIHIPLVTAFESYEPPPTKPSVHHGLSVANAYEVLPLFEGHNVLAVLQGHTHINEVVNWHGVPYITSGAVSGNWWHGTRMGTPEGFTVVTISGGKLTTRYETYGFHTIAPENT